MSKVYQLIYLCVTARVWFVLCEENIFYGIIVLRGENFTQGLAYKFIQKAHNPTKYASIKYRSKQDTYVDLKEQLKDLKLWDELKNMPTNKIFIRVLLKPFYAKKSSLPKFTELGDLDFKIIQEYRHLVNTEPVIPYVDTLDHILIYGMTNINNDTEEFERFTTIICRSDRLQMSFLALNPELSDHLITYNIKYKSQQHTVVASSFRCATPLEVSHIIFHHLMHKAENVDEIPYPCLPKESFTWFDPNYEDTNCVSDFPTKTKVKFTGAFNLQECQALIKLAITITQKGLVGQNDNFANMQLPLLGNNKYAIKLYTDIFDDIVDNRDIDKKSLDQKQNALCILDSDTGSIYYGDNECYHIVLLSYLIYDVMGFKGDRIFVAPEDFPEVSPLKYMYADPRLGLLVDKINFPPTSETLAVIKSTTTIISPTQKTSFQESTLDVTKVKPAALSPGKIAVMTIIIILCIIAIIVVCIQHYFKITRSLEQDL